MKLAWVFDFLLIIENGGFVSAADKIGISVSSLSYRIQRLEDWLEVKLLDRSGTPAGLTNDGVRFRSNALAVLESVEVLITVLHPHEISSQRRDILEQLSVVQFEDFVSLARSGSFSESAKEQLVTQPAFSRNAS